MLTTFRYKLNPSQSQLSLMDEWLNMLRSLYNFCLRERIEAYEQVKAPVMGNYCDLKTKAECCPLACSVNKNALYGHPWTKKGKRRSAGGQQDSCLPELKRARPWYKKINADVLQLLIRRLNKAFENFFEHGRGYPKPKRRSRFRSFAYKPKQVKIEENHAYLPGLGWMRFFNSRSIPDGFEIRTVTIRKKADGWYMAVQIRDDSVPDTPTIKPEEVQSALGVDVGIKKLVSLNTGETVPNPQFGKKFKRRKTIRQRRASRKKKRCDPGEVSSPRECAPRQGSRNRAKEYQKLARLDQKIVNQREDYHWKLANYLVNQADVVVFEDLNIKGMTARCKPKIDPETGKYLHNNQAAKSGLNKAILDAAWGELKLKTKAVAEKSGKLVLEVDPRYSSQECSHCGYISPTNRDKEKFLCESCGHYDDADVQASINILNRGLKTAVRPC